MLRGFLNQRYEALIDLHYVATPNGRKIALMLEEVSLPYNVISYDIFNGDQLTPEFGLINPNHKLPAIVDNEPADGAGPLPVFESGAILQYLAEKTGKLLPASGRGRSVAIQWLTWQVAGLGPMGGQATHFARYAPAGQDYGVKRYTREVRRLLSVLEGRLSEVDYLAGEYSIADIACWPGRIAAAGGPYLGINQAADYPAISDWCRRIAARPAAIATMSADHLKTPDKYAGARASLNPEEWSNMFGDNLHAAPGVARPR